MSQTIDLGPFDEVVGFNFPIAPEEAECALCHRRFLGSHPDAITVTPAQLSAAAQASLSGRDCIRFCLMDLVDDYMGGWRDFYIDGVRFSIFIK